MEEKIYTFSSNSLSLTEMFENVANHIFSKQSDLRKEIGEIMGGKILELESERLLRTGKEQGLIQGEEKAKLDIAKRMLERSFSLEDIQFSTGLSKKELEKIINCHFKGGGVDHLPFLYQNSHVIFAI